MKKTLIPLLFALTISSYSREYSLESPDNRIKLNINVAENLSFSVYSDGNLLIKPSVISISSNYEQFLGKNPKIQKIERKTVNKIQKPAISYKTAEIVDHYNELTCKFNGNFSLVFRAYNQGIAYRFETNFNDSLLIFKENTTYCFDENSFVWFPEEENFISHNERIYKYEKLVNLEEKSFCSLPVLINISNNSKILITDADLYDYPGTFLQVTGPGKLSPIHPSVVLKATPSKLSPDRNEVISKEAGYIAKTTGTRELPWRVIAISHEDKDLLMNQMVYLLSRPQQFDDASWIKPGKVAWDWWNALNVYGVDFESGINNETYKYYIDFASEFGLNYIILDEGWSPATEITTPVKDIDVEELCRYGREKNVEIILWTLWKPLLEKMDEALDLYVKWGVKGIKVDFMQRNDQWMVNYYEKVAEAAAKRKLLVDFHGSFKPSGLRKAYPNVISYEGVQGMEHCKWSQNTNPEHDATLPFTRNVVGPMDYTPGAMINASERNFRVLFTRPMSIGTRCHQLALYVVFESPLQMLADNPSNYYREKECMEFLSEAPTVWDETIVLAAKVSDYAILARRKGEKWFIGGITDNEARKFEIDFSFLKDGKHKIKYYQDGINVYKYASDYKKIETEITKDDKVEINMAPGGGWAAVVY